ncbi:actin cortical patch SUR7/pH-response regulator pali [Dendryphion nanum]|uniref:Actin cortical patch SUR7/pH-response regulator pali n=1 Tax=Dendryphion nanum TaxID=256645 RepID=A0A9P9IJ57_9PLEO|nr:actin cortical patch SUR7/pH-response regulator pali [Dendryphion nanum]
MRLLALLPLLTSTAALILTFLCLFAGSKPTLLQDYHLLTLNTSRLGYNLLNTTASTNTSNPFRNLWNDFRNNVNEEVNERIGDTAERLGIDDFYSLHMMNFCWGNYTPAPVGNATLKQSDIDKEVEKCSNRTAMFTWNPTATLEQKLNDTGLGITLEDLKWPDEIDTGITALQTLQKATFILYCLAIALIFVSLVAGLVAFFMSGRLSACVNVLLAVMAFVALGIASALVTAVIVRAAKEINKFTDDIGIEAHRGGKFLALTWAATGLVFVGMVVWCVEGCMGRRKREPKYVPKHG